MIERPEAQTIPVLLRRRVGVGSALVLWALMTVLAPARAFAQFARASPESQQTPPAPGAATAEGHSPGFERVVNFDATWGAFGFLNSLYSNPKPDEPSGNLGENWFEGSMKAGLTISYTTAATWNFWGKASAVGERTYGAAPSLVGEDASSFQVEDFAVGLKSGQALPRLGEDALELTVGRAPYQLGHSLLIGDGAVEGSTRGGYWTNARKAFGFASIARLHTAHHRVEAFYLVRDEIPEADSHTRVAGVNYEARLTKTTTLGATYLRFWANDREPQRNDLNVYNLRAYTVPIPGFQQLSFEFEYAAERNRDVLDSNAWNVQAAYELSDVKWTPKVSYRYAYFQGDNPATATSEAWDPLLPGFYDWGTWWQGEIAGEYFVSNSNLISHQARLHLAPSQTLGTGLILYDFLADQPASIAPGVTAKDVAVEVDWYADWKFYKHFTTSLVVAFANPGKVVQQVYDRTKNFAYAMAFVTYSY
jgi:hypothetical protein